MSHADFIKRYDVPAVDPAARRPEVRYPRRGEGRARSILGDVRARLRGPRLAYLDSHFPWQRSGFRYADADALLALRPDTLFFSMYEMRDAFPARVHALADFPPLAALLGITDVYGMFLDFMAGILGTGLGEPGVIAGLNLRHVLRREGIRAHAVVPPGGGFVETDPGFEAVRRMVAAADTVLSWSPAVIANVPGVVAIEPAILDTAFYALATHDFAARPLEVLFVADAKPRKGLRQALDAPKSLGDQPIHLHIVGPHDPSRWTGRQHGATFHGWLERAELRALHQRCHVIISPVSAEQPADPHGDGGITDGFPTAAAGEAMSSGCLLVSANPERDHRVLRPAVDYLEVDATGPACAAALRWVVSHPDEATTIAASGQRRVRERLDVRVGAGSRLNAIGLDRRPRAGGGRARRMQLSSPQRPPANPAIESIASLRGEIGELSRWLAILAETRAEQLSSLREQVDRQGGQLQALAADVLAIGEGTLDQEPATRDRLRTLRQASDYVAPFEDPEPLVSICIPTYLGYQTLIERAIPSALSQEEVAIEVVVVGDAAPPETARAVAALSDPRVRYENLPIRGPYPDDPERRWLVAGTTPLNRSIELAHGAWIVILNDDDALRPDHARSLVALAQDEHAEIAYGKFAQHTPDGSTEEIGAFPPASHRFGWQCAVQHRSIARLFTYERAAALFSQPGDWHRARRMPLAGVSFAMLDRVVFDYYPSSLWAR